eukprot:SAG31_NODE_3339_length_4386_cov_39.128528_4_plen_73_part_00
MAAAAGAGGSGQASQIYRLTTLGQTLTDALKTLEEQAAFDESLVEKVQSHFDRVRQGKRTPFACFADNFNWD